MFRTANGVGQSARYLYRGLKHRGLQVSAVDTSEILNQVNLDSDIELSEFPPPNRGGTLLLIANAPETRPILRAFKLKRWQNWKIIGYWAWELSKLDPSWKTVAHHLNEIWTPSEFVTRTLRTELDIPVSTVPIPVAPPANLDFERPPNAARTKYLCMADGRSSFHRKNILAAARMFRMAFEHRVDVELTIKLQASKLDSETMSMLEDIIAPAKNISVVDIALSNDDRWRLIHEHDVVLSPHHAEGFGLHIAEAMSLGKCAVATNWSGNLDFMSPRNSVLLPFTLCAAEDKSGVYSGVKGALWAKVDEAAGVAQLKALQNDPARLVSLGKQAQKDLRESFNAGWATNMRFVR
jgi:glycosyltransferase involved in cell wall biosynthesis